MTTQHNVLLMEMLFLGSVLMIIIVTNLAGELFLKTCTSDDTAIVYLTQRHCWNHSLWLILCQSYLRMCALGKVLVELLQILRHSYLFLATS